MDKFELKAARLVEASGMPISRKMLVKLLDHIDAQQAKIDRLMAEYCPDEMTPEQVEEWERYQVPEED